MGRRKKAVRFYTEDGKVRPVTEPSRKKNRLIRRIENKEKERYGFIEKGVWYPNSLFLQETRSIMLKRYGGYGGLERGLGVFDRILERVKAAKGIYRKAAVVLNGIGRGRIFKDGNHRIAGATMEIFLEMNGKKLAEQDPEKIYNFIKDVLCYDLNKIEAWIRHG